LSRVYHIRLQGKALVLLGPDYWVLVTSDNPKEGAIATREQWEAFEMNPAHLFMDGVYMLGSRIAPAEDVIIEEEIG